MKVHTIIAGILLILGCAGILQAEDDEGGESSESTGNQIDLSVPQGELQENFNTLQNTFNILQGEVDQLKRRVESLESSNSVGDNESVPTQESNEKSEPNQKFGIRDILLAIMMFLVIILLVLVLVFMMFWKKKTGSQYPKTSKEHKEEKTPAVKSEFASETKPLSSYLDSSRKYTRETNNRSPSAYEQTPYNSSHEIQPQGLSSSFPRTQTSPAASSHPARSQPAPMQPAPRLASTSPTQANPAYRPDEFSPLFQSKELRDKRSRVADVYVDLNAEIATRITQGEKIAPVFEEGGNFIGAPYVLIQGKDLYPNFYRFNEGRPIPKDKETTLQQIYDIEGSLPGLVDKCIPAQVIPQANQYTILKKGSMVIKTPV
jgi:cytoskeletal protein RodZ